MPPLDSPYQRQAHAPYQVARSRIIDALTLHAGPVEFTGHDPTDLSLKLAAKLGDCCKSAQIVHDEDDGLRIAERRCKSRICPRCALLRARALTARLLTALERMNSPRFLTLTLASSDEPLRDQIRRLTASFKRLRRGRPWNRHVSGGAYTIEATFNHSTRQWHPHLHALIDGRYWPQSSIADAWQAATGDSRIVDIRLVKDRQKQARYLASYAAKSSDIERLPDDMIPEWAHQVHGLRLVQTFGNLHGTKLTPDDDDERPGLDYLEWADPLAHAREQRDPDAAFVITALISARTGLPRNLAPATHDAHAPLVAEALSRLRRWQARQQKENHREAPQPPPDPTRLNRPRVRSLRLWQDDTPAGPDRPDPTAQLHR